MATLKSIKNKYLAATDGDTIGVKENTENLAILAFKMATADSLNKFNMVDGVIDDFQDTSGVDASASGNEIRNASNYYSGFSAVTATGGAITTDGDYKVHTFSSNVNYVTDTAQTIDYLIVGGGGGGGGSNDGNHGDPGGYRSGGAGGAGGYRSFTGVSLASGTFAVVVGTGGSGGAVISNGSAGGASSFNSQTSAGGGYGAASPGGQAQRNGSAGGSGGGGSASLPGNNAGGSGNSPSTSPAQGFGGSRGSSNYGGAGGGAGEAGGTDGSSPWRGGDGVSNSITGSAVTYAGGGSGGSVSATSGGDGGGGTGAGQQNSGGSGADGLGGGGGGAGNSEGGSERSGGSGGDGVVIIRRPTGIQYLDMTLISAQATAATAPSLCDIVILMNPAVGTSTINTHLIAYIGQSANSTPAYTSAVTLIEEGTQGSYKIWAARNVDTSALSGTNMNYKLTTHSQSVTKETRVQSVALAWR